MHCANAGLHSRSVKALAADRAWKSPLDAAIHSLSKGAAMNQKTLSGEDIQVLNEQILSHDEHLSNLAKRRLFESVNHPECFANSIAQEWARRIVNRVNRSAYRRF